MRRGSYESLRREYAAIAHRYDLRWHSYVEASTRETLGRTQVVPGDRLLDVGCGTGRLLKAMSLAAPEAEIFGIDLSVEMLEVGRRRVGPAVHLGQAHAEALPFRDAEFDAVVSANVFHFIRRPQDALQEMYRVLRSGGRLVITDWCDDFLACRICDVFLRLFSPAHFRTYGSKECGNLLMAAGFTDFRVERYRISWLWGLMTATAVKPAHRQGHQEGGESRHRGQAGSFSQSESGASLARERPPSEPT